MSMLLNRAHAWLYRRSGGRLLGRMGGQRVLLLTTKGRRTGLPRTTPVQCTRVGEALIVVASNRGSRTPPNWYQNLRADPRVRVQLGRETLQVRAREVTEDERDRLWSQLVVDNRWLAPAQERAGRRLPLIALDPPASPTTLGS
jgi:deazaflavin-dependent oxidoreductase (nitroreductase family)